MADCMRQYKSHPWTEGATGAAGQGYATKFMDLVNRHSLLRPSSSPPMPTKPNRPKSSPARQSKVRFQDKNGGRPKTAAPGTCERLQTVAYEPTRTHNFENHLRLQKKKPSPWQNALDGPLTTYQKGHGYELQKNKAKVTMRINMDDFFDPVVEEEVRMRPQLNTELDGFIKQLEQQVLDLSLYLEEEKIDHKETKRKHVEYMKDKLQDQKSQCEAELRTTQDMHEKELDVVRNALEKKLIEQQAKADANTEQMKNEIKFLQGAFDSFKTQVTIEMNDKWHAKEKDLKQEFDNNREGEKKEMRAQISRERMAEKASMTREFSKQMQEVMREHKKELDAFKKRYSSAAGDLARLQQVDRTLEEMQNKHKLLKAEYESVCKHLTTTINELTDTKIKLIGYEENFQEKIQEVDDKYKQQIHSLMMQNTELRRLYIKKCGQLFEEQAETDKKRVEKVSSAKETMQVLIKTRSKAEVSVAALEASLDSKLKIPRERPASAPSTKQESLSAKLSAGETKHVVDQRLEKEDRKFIRPHTSVGERKPVTDDDIIEMISITPLDDIMPTQAVSR